MNDAVRAALDAIPERPPRSKLEPHAAVIRELRKKRRTYQEIATFFREHLQISVAPSTIHEFVKVRARQARLKKQNEAELPDTADSRSATASTERSSSAEEAVREQIRTVKQRAVATPESPVFSFDPEQPLRIVSPKEKK
jgi:IS30 family transposase